MKKTIEEAFLTAKVRVAVSCRGEFFTPSLFSIEIKKGHGIRRH